MGASVVIDMTGQTIGRWTVLRRSESVIDGRRAAWVCRCACGTERPIPGTSLRRGRSLSCGCAVQPLPPATRHAHAPRGRRSPEYYVWGAIVARCTNPRSGGWKKYGARGIRVCDRWRDFVAFLADMGQRPSPQHSIERRNNDGDYEPGNCRWGTDAEQRRNKRTSRFVTFRGETRILQDWSTATGLAPSTIGARLNRGWSAERALTTPVSAADREGTAAF